MSVDDLEGIRQKILRAGEHLQEVTEAVSEYVVTGEYGIKDQLERQIPEKSGRPGRTWRVDIGTPPPPRIAVLCGDVLHNIRSSLDHLAWALVIQSGGQPQIPGTRFPILKEGSRRPPTIEGGVPAAVSEILDVVQPYQAGHQPLAQLAELSNIDKHRRLNVVAISLGQITIRFVDQGRTGHVSGGGEHGALLFWDLEESDAYDPETRVELEYEPILGFREQGVSGIEADVLLRRILDHARDQVIQRIARACFGGELDFPRPIF